MIKNRDSKTYVKQFSLSTDLAGVMILTGVEVRDGCSIEEFINWK